jgi:hypothetical protein
MWLVTKRNNSKKSFVLKLVEIGPFFILFGSLAPSPITDFFIDNAMTPSLNNAQSCCT